MLMYAPDIWAFERTLLALDPVMGVLTVSLGSLCMCVTVCLSGLKTLGNCLFFSTSPWTQHKAECERTGHSLRWGMVDFSHRSIQLVSRPDKPRVPVVASPRPPSTPAGMAQPWEFKQLPCVC